MTSDTKTAEMISLTTANGVTSAPSDVSVERADRDRPVRMRVKNFLLANLLLLLTCAGIVLGFVIGFSVRELSPSKDALMWLGEW